MRPVPVLLTMLALAGTTLWFWLERTRLEPPPTVTMSPPLSSVDRSQLPARSALVAVETPFANDEVTAAASARAMARIDPRQAVAWAHARSDPRVRLRALREVFAIWTEMDPQAAVDALAKVSPEEMPWVALAIGHAWARAESIAALAWSAKLPQEARTLVRSGTFLTWAEHDAIAALEWYSDLPDPVRNEIDPGIIGTALEHWAGQDPISAREFVLMLPPDAQAEAVKYMTPSLAQADALATIQWSLRLADAASSEALLTQAFRRWHETVPENAESWLRATALSDEQKTQLLGYP